MQICKLNMYPAAYQPSVALTILTRVSRKSSATAESLASYQSLIETAKAELEVHLELIDSKLDSVLGRNMPKSDMDTSELQTIRDERLSAEKCLQICTQLSEHISQIQVIPEDPHSFPGYDGSPNFPEIVTNESLQECKRNLGLTTAKLEKHMQALMNRLLAKSKPEMSSEEYGDLTRLRDEWDTARQCIEICSKADDRLKENISTIENYATGDAVQFMVSTDGNTIRGKNRGLGWRSRQVGGHLSDASVQQLSRDIATINIRHLSSVDQIPRKETAYAPDSETGSQPPSEFKDRYGRGFKLTPETSGTFDRV